MNRRVLAVLIVLVLATGGAALFMRAHDESADSATAMRLGQPLLKDLKASDVASIVIRERAATLTLAKKGNAWVVAEKRDFPVDLDKVTELVVKAIGLKVGQSEPIADKDRSRLDLIEPAKAAPDAVGQATELAFKAADGRILAELLLGKKYFKTPPEGDPAKASADGRFVLLPQDPQLAYVVAEPFSRVRAASAEWISKSGFAIERVRNLEVTPAEGEGYAIERATDGPDWKFVRSGGKLDNAKANSAAYSLARIDLDDLAASDKPEDNGLDKPSVIKATTFDGLAYTLRIGRPDAKDRYPLRVAVEGTPQRTFEERKDEKPEAAAARRKSFDEEMKKLAERVTQEKALADFTLLVPKAKLADVLKKRSELLEQKPVEAKKK